MQGRLRDTLSRDVSFGELSFNHYKPSDMMVTTGSDIDSVFRGPAHGLEQAYVVAASFYIKEHNLHGVHKAIAEYNLVDDQPARTEIVFKGTEHRPCSCLPCMMR